MADGALAAFYSGGTPPWGIIIIDVNGNNLPNKYGVDTFWFTFDSTSGLGVKGFQPYGGWGCIVDNSASSGCNATKTTSDGNNGRRCTAWALTNENIDYIHCSDLNWATKKTCN